MSLGPWPTPTVSASSLAKWETCRRSYFWATYWSWTGWESAAPASRQLAYKLKKADSVHSIAGTLVHREAIRLCQSIVDGPIPDVVKAVDRVTRKIATWAIEAPKVTVETATKARPLSIEAYYGEPIKTGEAVDNAAECLRNLWDSPHVEYLSEATPKDVGPGERVSPILLLDEAEGVTIDVDGWTVDLWGAPDLVYEGARGEVRVVDWKTGKERPTDRTQLDLYALWLDERNTVTPDRDIRATADYLRTGVSREHIPNPDRALERIAGMLGELRKHVDGRNKPNIEPARWPKLAEGSKACGWCEYRRLCRR